MSRGTEDDELKLLLVEDNPGDVRLVREALADSCASDPEAPRIEMAVAANAADAISCANQARFDVLLLDLSLPDTDGIETFTRIRASVPGTPIVILSGMEDESFAAHAVREGAQDYLMKSRIDGDRLLRALRYATLRARAASDRIARQQLERENKIVAAANAALAASETRFRTIQEASPDGLSIFEPVRDEDERVIDFTWRYVNPAGAQLLKRTANELEGERLSQVLPASLENGFFALCLDALATEGTKRLEIHDELTETSLRNVAFRLGDGIAVMFEDVTERRRSDAERAVLFVQAEAARTRAEEANRAKDEFLATISHELRTPLNAILGWTRMLIEGGLTHDKRATALEVIDRNATAQARLIEDLLDVSRIITGKLQLEVVDVELPEIVASVVETVRPALEAKSIWLRSSIDPRAGIVSCDPVRMQQVVWNLLSNAIKFTPRGGKIELIVRRVDGSVEIQVSDDGQGITPEFLPRLFRRFEQSDGSIRRAHGGLGLGLSISRHLVEQHGGTIEAVSEGVGKGATFIVKIPFARARAQGSAAMEAEAATSTKVLAGVRVLIVDDEEDSRSLSATILQRSGAITQTAASADSALETLAKNTFDIVVSDIGMPEQDGYMFMSTLRKRDAAHGGLVPAIALTAYARSEDRQRALGAGYQTHVPKPIEPGELVAVVLSLAKMSAKATPAEASPR